MRKLKVVVLFAKSGWLVPIHHYYQRLGNLKTGSRRKTGSYIQQVVLVSRAFEYYNKSRNHFQDF